MPMPIHTPTDRLDRQVRDMRHLAWSVPIVFFFSSLPLLAADDFTYAMGNATVGFATVCSNAKYVANSTYQYNVHHATAYLASYPTYNTGTGFGFATVTYGDPPDVVYALGLCRGDTPDWLTCYECLGTASVVAPMLCPYDRDTTLFYDGCIMRFSDKDFLGTKDNEPVVMLNSTVVKPAAVARSFDTLVNHLLDMATEQAAASDVLSMKMATGEAVFGAGDQQTTVYTLVQCTPSLTPGECSGCLKKVMDTMALRRPGSLGQRVAGVRCNIRFEVYPFYVGEAMVRIEGSNSSSPAPLPSNTSPGVSTRNKRGTKSKIWIIAVSVCLFLLLLCIFVALMCTRSRCGDQRNSNPQSQEGIEGNIWRIREGSMEFSMFEFSQVANATDNFSDGNKLGEGGFGPVYKGQLPNGLKIAVKRLNPKSGQGLNEFKTEIHLIAKLQHTNLVRLLGFCIQGEEKILVYEYMSNKSLDFFIFDAIRGASLHWNRRRQIIDGIAQGLLYLHKHSRLRVVHRDLKASNILLDDNLGPKISDFGLARIFGSNETHANTGRVVGTHGYMAPEYASEGLFSIKSDVFSFGVLLIEIITGKRNTGFHQTGNFPNLIGYAWLLWNEGKWLEVVDPCLDVKHHDAEIMRFINVALMCVQDNAIDRPTMTDVIAMLMNESTSLPEPKQPAYFNIRAANKEVCLIEFEKSNSINDVTNSPPKGR